MGYPVLPCALSVIYQYKVVGKPEICWIKDYDDPIYYNYVANRSCTRQEVKVLFRTVLLIPWAIIGMVATSWDMMELIAF